MEKVTELEFTIALQIKLEAMTDKELKEFLKDKVLIYKGQKYGFVKPKKKTKKVQ
jgi:hypothetical protein